MKLTTILLASLTALLAPIAQAQISTFTASSLTVDLSEINGSLPLPADMDSNCVQIVGMNGSYVDVGIIAPVPYFEVVNAGVYGSNEPTFLSGGNPYVLEYMFPSSSTVLVWGFAYPQNPCPAITIMKSFAGSFTNASVRGYVSAPNVRVVQGDELSVTFTLQQAATVTVQSLGPTMTVFGLRGAANVVTTIYALTTYGAGTTTTVGEGVMTLVLPAGAYTAVTRASSASGIALLSVSAAVLVNPNMVNHE